MNQLQSYPAEVLYTSRRRPSYWFMLGSIVTLTIIFILTALARLF